jgi:hypothetical protein
MHVKYTHTIRFSLSSGNSPATNPPPDGFDDSDEVTIASEVIWDSGNGYDKYL